jgi:hypothetical protein
VLVMLSVPFEKSNVSVTELGGGPLCAVSLYSHGPKVDVPV